MKKVINFTGTMGMSEVEKIASVAEGLQLKPHGMFMIEGGHNQALIFHAGNEKNSIVIKTIDNNNCQIDKIIVPLMEAEKIFLYEPQI